MLQKFVQPLRGVGPGGIPVAAADAFPAPVTGALHYSFNINQYEDTLHPDLDPTTLWGFHPVKCLGGAQRQRHLGGLIVAHRGTPIQLTFYNNLPAQHILPVDTSLMGADGMPNRTSVHLHGGFVPWISDGGPSAWFDPYGQQGPTFRNNRVLNPGAPKNAAEYYYPNDQSARMLWYHDHAMGITRLNAYAGIASAYLLRDGFESDLRNFGLPDFVENGGAEIPLVIQDKVFVGVNIANRKNGDLSWLASGAPSTVGSLWYPHIYEPDRWDVGPNGMPPDPSCIPEMFGDTMLVNGTAYPEAQVESRRYRLRILNACNARFLNLQLYVDDGSPLSITLDPNTLRPTNQPGPDFLVIGTEGGFLPKPVIVSSHAPFDRNTISGSLITAPAERWDLIVDFRGFAGKSLVLYNDAPAPFPDGDSETDFFEAPNAPTKARRGPNTRQLMRFRVSGCKADAKLNISPQFDLSSGLDRFLVPPGFTGAVPPPPGVKIRQLTLNETFDGAGRLIQMIGTTTPVSTGDPNQYGMAFMDPATETPEAGSTEAWQILNLTADTHPMHFHLVNVQILSRQAFDPDGFGKTGVLVFAGEARGPEPTETGWKETVRMNPGEVTTVLMRFDLPKVPFHVPSSPGGGYEYVWHCHILEHEEHDMMRPLVIT